MENLKNHSKEGIFEKVSDIVAELFEIDKNEIKMESLLEKDFGGDALDIIELIMTLEQVFGVSFPDEPFAPNVDVDDEAEYVNWDEEYNDCDEDDEEEYDDEECDDEKDDDFDVDYTESASEPYTLTVGDYVDFIYETLKNM